MNEPSSKKQPRHQNQSSPRSSLIKNQEHPFQPQHNSIKNGEQESYQSMKQKIAAVKYKLNDREVEMRHIQPNKPLSAMPFLMIRSHPNI
jgi:hypothetical protein